MRFVKALLAAAIAAAFMLPADVIARPGDKRTRIVVYPKSTPKARTGPYGFLPGYRQPLPLGEWRDRDPAYGPRYSRYQRRYWSGGEWRYGWGYPRFYRGRWNAGTFGPCWNQTPIGPMWNCGM